MGQRDPVWCPDKFTTVDFLLFFFFFPLVPFLEGLKRKTSVSTWKSSTLHKSVLQWRVGKNQSEVWEYNVLSNLTVTSKITSFWQSHNDCPFPHAFTARCHEKGGILGARIQVSHSRKWVLSPAAKMATYHRHLWALSLGSNSWFQFPANVDPGWQ